MQEERHYLPSSAWSRNRMSSPAHAHTNTHFYTLANCERVSEEGWAREWERENAIRREGRSRKDAEDRESGEEMQQPERQWGGGEWGGGHIAAHTVMCAVLNCTCMTEVCVCACLCVRECVFPMSLSVEGKWQMWLSPLHDHLSPSPSPSVTFTLIWDEWTGGGENAEAKTRWATGLNLWDGQMNKDWQKDTGQNSWTVLTVHSVCILISFHHPFATSYSLPVPCPLEVISYLSLSRPPTLFFSPSLSFRLSYFLTHSIINPPHLQQARRRGVTFMSLTAMEEDNNTYLALLPLCRRHIHTHTHTPADTQAVTTVKLNQT